MALGLRGRFNKHRAESSASLSRYGDIHCEAYDYQRRGENTATKADYISVTQCPDGPFRRFGITGTYATLQDAYDASSDGDIIQALALTFIEYLDANRPVMIGLDGGYTCDYASNPDQTTLQGELAITDGEVTVNGLVVQ